MSRTLAPEADAKPASRGAGIRRALATGAALGVTQGVAEVVPISSSAHLALLPWWRGWPEPPGRTTLAAGLHAGSCVGIAWAMRAELAGLARTPAGRRTAGLVAVASVPVAVAGYLVDDAVERRLGRPEQLAVLVAGAGAALAWADLRGGEPRANLTASDAAAAGLAQVAALVPGISRGGATLTALRWRGVDRFSASRFSLLMSLPVTAGAAALTLARADRALLQTVAAPLAVGAPIAALTSAITVTRTVSRVSAVPPLVIALYRLGLGVAVAAVLRERRRAGRGLKRRESS